MFNKNLITKIIATKFPPINLAWAYGSAVFPQSYTPVSNSNSNMIDIFFVVEDPLVFHSLNMKMNANHYSGLSYVFGPSYISLINSLIFPIHFNSHVSVNGLKMKYGVLS